LFAGLRRGSREKMAALPRGKLVNIGERGALLNGADWADSELWHLASKMKPDFSDAVLTQLAGAPGVVMVGTMPRPVQAVISASGAPIDAAATGNRHTASALNLAEEKTDRAFKLSGRHVAKSLKTVRRTFGKWLK